VLVPSVPAEACGMGGGLRGVTKHALPNSSSDRPFTACLVACALACARRSLHYAALHGHAEVVAYLLQRASDRGLSARCAVGCTVARP
jgi:hypothetical protein